MSDSVFIGKSAAGYSTSPALSPYTKVVIIIDDETFVEAGDGDNVLELTCPWATAQMAEDILQNLSNFSYQPYDTEWAKLDPSAELGDGVTINGVFSGIYTNETTFSTLMAARIAAPQENAVDHEYPYKSKTDRKVSRQFANTRASLRVNAASIEAEVTARKKAEDEIKSTLELHADEIAARVTQSGGSSSSFGWSLTVDGFILESSGQTVFAADKDGISVKGRISATSGFIGNETDGFTITSSALFNKLDSLYGTVEGVYIGTDGIALGGGKFRVTNDGRLYAEEGTFAGNVYAKQIQVGGNYGYVEGDQIGMGTISTANTNGYLNGGIANGYYASDVFSGAAIANYCGAQTLAGNIINASKSGLYWGGNLVYRHGFTVHDGDFIWMLDADTPYEA